MGDWTGLYFFTCGELHFMFGAGYLEEVGFLCYTGFLLYSFLVSSFSETSADMTFFFGDRFAAFFMAAARLSALSVRIASSASSYSPVVIPPVGVAVFTVRPMLSQ